MADMTATEATRGDEASPDGPWLPDIISRDLQTLLFAAAMRITRVQEEELSRLDQPLTVTQYRVLAQVSNGWTSAVELASIASRSQASMSGVINGLVQRGYLERQVCPTDRRTTILALTTSGQRALDDGARCMRELAEQILPDTSPQRAQQLEEDLLAIFRAASEVLREDG